VVDVQDRFGLVEIQRPRLGCDTIARAVEDIDLGTTIVGLLKAESERTRLETLAFLRDTLYGRPAQSVSLSGAVVHAHGLWRPFLPGLAWDCNPLPVRM
jgi:hypothetical protein